MGDGQLTRREVLAGLLGAGAAAGLAACTRTAPPQVGPSPASAEPTTGTVRALGVRARPVELDLGGRTVATWAYGDSVPGPPVRATAGDMVRIDFRNDLPEETSVHWHGLAIPHDMDGVPHLTSEPVPPGGSFAFAFVVPDPGTYWFHPHTGLQLDRGLYAPFIVDDPAEPGDYDAEWIVVLDDWTDGLGASPDQILADLRSRRGPMMGMHGGGSAWGDVAYPAYLINGRTPQDPSVLRAGPGQRVRLRIINAGADTVFDVALAGHALQVTHTDGFAVEPVTTGAIRVAMGERYDAVVTLAEGVFPLVAVPVGKSGEARALIRTGSGAVPGGDLTPEGLQPGDALTASALRAAPGTALPAREPDSVQDLVLSGSMGRYQWFINGRTYDDTVPLAIATGSAGRLRIRNHSMMAHPVHLHGHTFQLGAAGGAGPRKDTLLVPAMAAADVDFAADNPGRWMLHCHNAYHAEAGMMTRLDYAD